MNTVVTVNVLWSLTVIMAISIIILIVVTESRHTSIDIDIPSHVDVIVLDRGNDRLSYQLATINQYMTWAYRIVILRQTMYPVYKESRMCLIDINTLVIDTNEINIHQLVDTIYSTVPDLAETFVFLGDTTFPIKPVSKRDFWSISKRSRVFNLCDMDYMGLGTPHYYKHTIPITLIKTDTLRSYKSLNYYMIGMIVNDQLVYSPHINKSVLLLNHQSTDKTQMDKHAPEQLFTTLLIDPACEPCVYELLNKLVVRHMSEYIVI